MKLLPLVFLIVFCLGSTNALTCDQVANIVSKLSWIAKLALKAAFFLIRRDLPTNSNENSDEIDAEHMMRILDFIEGEEKVPQKDKELIRSLVGKPDKQVKERITMFGIDLSAAYNCLKKIFNAAG